jgi:hypothetical protein
MPKLGQTNIQQVFLPSTAQSTDEADKAWVKVNTQIRIADIEQIEDYDRQIDQSAYALSKLIVEWNLTALDSDEIAPITPENVKQLSTQDFNFLSEWLKGKVEDQSQGVATPLKETSSSTLLS